MRGLILLLPRILSRSPSSLFPPFAYRTMNSVAKQKTALRSQMRSLLRRHYDSLLQHEDAMIQKNVLESEWYNRSNHICGYISCNSIWDVGTSKIIQDIFSTVRTDHQKFLYVPWIQDKQSHMKFFQIDSSEHLATNSFGILEPIPMKSDGSPRQDVMAIK
ncbi:hypothetical protein KP509_09G049900 [Ceratopteris richardii]|uniref:5-formyltetrahydrofolate cyclo-ligase n=1 Tax=Ceratopteris richardii TaxID=49495 RepID=A0A8T2U7A0_CERRI|nr:hypothetical protein KP509_09G049900 [Ceratopteris richardii]